MSTQTIKNNEFGYLGNPSVKRDGVQSQFTKAEVIEYQKCMRDPAYFARKHLKVISLDDGLVPFDLIILNKTDLLLFWLVDNPVSLYHQLVIYYGTQYFTQKKQLLY